MKCISRQQKREKCALLLLLALLLKSVQSSLQSQNCSLHLSSENCSSLQIAREETNASFVDSKTATNYQDSSAANLTQSLNIFESLVQILSQLREESEELRSKATRLDDTRELHQNPNTNSSQANSGNDSRHQSDAQTGAHSTLDLQLLERSVDKLFAALDKFESLQSGWRASEDRIPLKQRRKPVDFRVSGKESESRNSAVLARELQPPNVPFNGPQTALGDAERGSVYFYKALSQFARPESLEQRDCRALDSVLRPATPLPLHGSALDSLPTSNYLSVEARLNDIQQPVAAPRMLDVDAFAKKISATQIAHPDERQTRKAKLRKQLPKYEQLPSYDAQQVLATRKQKSSKQRTSSKNRQAAASFVAPRQLRLVPDSASRQALNSQSKVRTLSQPKQQEVYEVAIPQQISDQSAPRLLDAATVARELQSQPQTIQLAAVPSIGFNGNAFGFGSGGNLGFDTYFGRQFVDRRQDLAPFLWALVVVLTVPMIAGALFVPLFLKTVSVIIRILQSFGLIVPVTSLLTSQVGATHPASNKP